MGSFLSNIFGGSNPTLNENINESGNIEGFGTSVGEGDTSAASGFFSTLLGGNPAQESKLLAPEIKTIQDQGQQQLQTQAQFGNRSGGVNASGQQSADKTRSNVDDMISKLTGQAASGLQSIGSTEQGLGLSADQLQAQQAQERQNNQQQSILGQLFGGAADSAGMLLGQGIAGIPSLFSGGGSGGAPAASAFPDGFS